MTDVLERKGGRWGVFHAGKWVNKTFETTGDAWQWADCNIDDQMFDEPNSFLPPIEYEQCHCGAVPVTCLDGDNLCQEHADEWVRGERP